MGRFQLAEERIDVFEYAWSCTKISEMMHKKLLIEAVAGSVGMR